MKSEFSRVLTALSFLLLPVLGIAQGNEYLVTSEDLDQIIGEWQGSLTYIDYSSGAPYTMPVEATIAAGKKANILLLQIVYPNEPKANNSSKIVISSDGKTINKQSIVSRLVNASGEVEIISEINGKDDNRKATIRHTYIFGKTRYINRKEVRFAEHEDWLKRNEFNYRRK